jgi:hypothetical protein
MVAMTLCWSCVGSATDVPEDTAGREAFIGAYLDLRTTALRLGTTDLGDEIRDSILSEHDITGQDMLDFVDAHGEDIEFMRELWSELETRMTERLEQIARDEDADGADEPEDDETEEFEETRGVDQIGAGDAGVSP